jgi:hypothetical protein
MIINHLIFFVIYYFIIKHNYASAAVHQHEFKHWSLKYKLVYYDIIDSAVGHSF